MYEGNECEEIMGYSYTEENLCDTNIGSENTLGYAHMLAY